MGSTAIKLPAACDVCVEPHRLGLLPAGCFSEGDIHIPVGVDSEKGKIEGQHGSGNIPGQKDIPESDSGILLYQWLGQWLRGNAPCQVKCASAPTRQVRVSFWIYNSPDLTSLWAPKVAWLHSR